MYYNGSTVESLLLSYMYFLQNEFEFAEDQDYTTELDRISARWGGFEDGETGVVYYRWGLGTEPGLVDEWPWEHVSLNTC